MNSPGSHRKWDERTSVSKLLFERHWGGVMNESELQSIKTRQKAMWESGDFGRVAKFNMPAAEEFMASLPLQPGMKVLDVACGSGNLAVIAARRGCAASGVDIATNLIAQAREWAAAEQLNVEFREGDAE